MCDRRVCGLSPPFSRRLLSLILVRDLIKKKDDDDDDEPSERDYPGQKLIFPKTSLLVKKKFS